MLFFADNLDVIQHLFPRQSKSDEDYNDRFSVDLNPESQTVRTPQQAGQKTSGEEADIEDSSLEKVPSSEETGPASYQLYKTPVPADPDDKSDLYFIGKFALLSKRTASQINLRKKLLQIHTRSVTRVKCGPVTLCKSTKLCTCNSCDNRVYLLSLFKKKP